MSGGMEFEFTADTGELVGAMEAGAGAAEDFAHAMDAARDANAEFGATAGEATAGVTGEAAGLEAAAASMKKLRDEHGRFITVSGGVRDGIQAESDAMRELRQESRRAFMDSAADSLSAASGVDAYRKSLHDAHAAAAEAERGINDLQNATSKSEVGRISLAHGLKDTEKAFREVKQETHQYGSILGFLGDKAKGAVGMGLSPMSLGIAGLAGVAAGAVPSVLSLGGGFAAFGALAAPALSKVKTGLSEVTYAQQQYQMAKAIEARDPSKSNLEDEQKALAQLQSTWAAMPKPVRGAVSEIRQAGHAFSEAGRKSGIQKSALGDIKLVAKDAQAAMPAVTGLAKAAQPLVHGLLTDVGKEFKSKGFMSFIHGLEKDMGPAAHAMKGIGNAVGGFITQLTGREAKPGTAMLQSIGKFLHTITPGAVSGLVGLTKGVTGLFNAMDEVANSKFVSDTVKAGKALGHFFHSDTGMSFAALQAKAGLEQKLAEKGLDVSGATRKLGSQQHTMQIQTIVRAHYKVERGDITGLGNSLAGVRSALVKATKVDLGHLRIAAHPDDVKKQIADAAKTGGNIPVKGRVTLTGLAAGIKSQIASLHIPDTKVKLSIQVTGAGAAKGAMAQVVGAARKDAQGAAAALASLGKAGSAAGGAMDAGLAAGINAGAGEVAAAAAHVAGLAASAMRAEAEIHSPSKKTEKIGRQLDDGVVKGLLGGESEVRKAAAMIADRAMPFRDSTIEKTIRRMRADVRMAFHHGDITKGQRDSYIDFIDRGNTRLEHLARRRAQLEREIHAATQLAAGITQNAIEGGGGIVGFGQAALAAKNAGKPSGTIQQQQETQLANIRKFRHEIIALKKEGLDKRDIRDIEKAGISGGGMATAEQLLGQGPAAIKQTAKLERQVEQAAKRLGVTGANAAYESGSQIGKGLAAGLRGELGAVEHAMAQLARDLVNEVRKDLGLPPLKGGKGGHGGGHGGHHRLHHQPGGGGGMQMLPGGGHLFGPGGGTPVRMHPGAATHVVVHAHMNVDGREMATVVQTHSLRRARRNTATGLKLANRQI